MEGLGVGAFIERDQVSIWVKDCEFLRSPWLARERGIRMNYGVAHAPGMQAFDSLNLYSATCGFRDVPIGAGPEMDLDWTVGDNAVLTLGDVDFGEAEPGREELGTSLDIKRCENGRRGNELGLCIHGVLHATPNV